MIIKHALSPCRDQDFQWDRDEPWEIPKPPSGGNNSTQLGPTAPRCVIT